MKFKPGQIVRVYKCCFDKDGYNDKWIHETIFKVRGERMGFTNIKLGPVIELTPLKSSLFGEILIYEQDCMLVDNNYIVFSPKNLPNEI